MALKARFSMRDIKGYEDGKVSEIEAKIAIALQFEGEKFVKNAREMTAGEGGFNDQTGNLRSSIGFVMIQNGEIIIENFKLSPRGTDRATGVSVAKAFIDQTEQVEKGLQLVCTAGMEYASHVENTGRNVISVQTIEALNGIEKRLKKIKV